MVVEKSRLATSKIPNAWKFGIGGFAVKIFLRLGQGDG